MSMTQFCIGCSMLVAGLAALSVSPIMSAPGLLTGWIVASSLLAISGAVTISTAETPRMAAFIALSVLGISVCFALFHSFLDRTIAGAVVSAELLTLGAGWGFRMLHQVRTAQQPVLAAFEFGLSAPAPGQDEIPESDLERRLLAKLDDGACLAFRDDEEEEPHLQFENADRHVAQRIERGYRADGSEWMEGMLLVEFQARQKTAIVHLPVWPAFATQPEIQSELLGGPDLDIEVKTIRRWGLRIELTRRASGLDPDSAELAFFISAQAAVREAA
ncbi:MAG TPA: hypothetical protein VLA12_14085 [Planctomycetaceae bacterium]|nr:hypothetical protein [Planctomycetaceae bacterium]